MFENLRRESIWLVAASDILHFAFHFSAQDITTPLLFDLTILF